jgi:hypothetical protein
LSRQFVMDTVKKLGKRKLASVWNWNDGEKSNDFLLHLDTDNSRKLCALREEWLREQAGWSSDTTTDGWSSHFTRMVNSLDRGSQVTRPGVVKSLDPNDETERRSRTAKANGGPSPSQRRKEQAATTSKTRKSRRKDEPLIATYDSECPICGKTCRDKLDRITLWLRAQDPSEKDEYAHWECVHPEPADPPEPAAPPAAPKCRCGGLGCNLCEIEDIPDKEHPEAYKAAFR